MSTPTLTLPFWFQVLLGVIAILGFLGGSCFALFVIWPSIRRSNRVSDWIERDGKALIETLKGKMTMTGESSTRSEFSKESSSGAGSGGFGAPGKFEGPGGAGNYGGPFL